MDATSMTPGPIVPLRTGSSVARPVVRSPSSSIFSFTFRVATRAAGPTAFTSISNALVACKDTLGGRRGPRNRHAVDQPFRDRKPDAQGVHTAHRPRQTGWSMRHHRDGALESRPHW